MTVKNALFFKYVGNRNNAASHTTPADEQRLDKTIATACVAACAPPPASPFNWRTRLRGHDPQGL